ncbi:hypothetical protein QNI19_12695 [Cytophagaceae bacterium DM2B3-1]|uniref:DUF7674 domain-containing protein n=1 Tax=Xanthocytophaga flava TaxID=3048013 RepID=A0ABT7CLB2_9BACT|nr:hypothetical protein [Xanthocytophaga flavus]MDJ1493792.1 hypothetical protein [Xanthocytophaga flavus]
MKSIIPLLTLWQSVPSESENKEETISQSDRENIYTLIQELADQTKAFALSYHFKDVRRCFMVAEDLLQHSDAQIRSAVSNVYLYSLSTLLDENNSLSSVLRSLLLPQLRKGYYEQLRTSLP